MCKIASHTTSRLKDNFSSLAVWQLVIHQTQDTGTDGGGGMAGALDEMEQRDLISFFTKVEIPLKERPFP